MLVRFVCSAGRVRSGVSSDLLRAEVGGEVLQIARLLAPVEPSQIIGVGLNYRRHAEETGLPLPREPVTFMKSLNTVVGPFADIEIPAIASDPPEVDYEVELAVVIDRPCRDVSEADALSFVRGYTVANDVSARRWQGKKGGNQWCRAKSFDTFCPLGPALRLAADVPDPQNLALWTDVDGQRMQESNTSDMIFSVAQIVSNLSRGATLLPDTVILTGTPEGVGYVRDPPVYLAPGSLVTVGVEGIGELSNVVVSA